MRETDAAAAGARADGQPFDELARLVLGDRSLTQTMQRVVDLGRDHIEGADEVSVTLIIDGRPATVAFSGSLAAMLDERQYEQGYGPCMDAAVTSSVILIEDTTYSPLYPDFARQTRSRGIRQVLAIGFPPLPRTNGALNVYSGGDQGPLTPSARGDAIVLADHAAVALANAAVLAAAIAKADQLRQAMASRSVIEQAKGMLMATRRCTADEAFAVLRGASIRSNRKLRDIAQAMVDSAGSPEG